MHPERLPTPRINEYIHRVSRVGMHWTRHRVSRHRRVANTHIQSQPPLPPFLFVSIAHEKKTYLMILSDPLASELE